MLKLAILAQHVVALLRGRHKALDVALKSSNYLPMIFTLTHHYAKYVDETTTLSISDDPIDNSQQSVSIELCNFCNLNGMVIESRKTK